MTELDISYRSMSILEKSVGDFLQDSIWVPDWQQSIDQKEKKNCENVLCMGLYYQRIFELNYWPEGAFSFYCLSHSVKSVLTKLYGFDDEVVSVIPRYKLFQKNQTTIPFPVDSSFHLVHAGRISPQKNIEFIIFVTFYFQLLVSPEIELTLMGNFDNDHHRNSLGIFDTDYRNKIFNLINSLPWLGNKPYIFSDLNHLEWQNSFPKNGLFFSASNLISEDFSVSIAQLQQSHGAPCLLPYWGGLKDVRGSNIKFYSVEGVGSSNDNFSSISNKAKAFVESFINQDLFCMGNLPALKDEVHFPQKINRAYLGERVRKNKERWGAEIEYICQGNFHLFAKTENGQNFFREYFKIFSE